MAREGVDVLVIGGGVTGAGIALDAAARGLRTGIVEMQDWSAGTSSRSSRLVHGGLRYLYQLDVPLVAEALRERGRLLDVIAPHLVHAQPFLWPLRTPVIERAYSAVGVGLYDVIARSRGGRLPMQRHLSRTSVERVFPDVRSEQLVGAIRFFDARVDDARLVISLVRTAQQHGAHAAAHTRVIGFQHAPGGGAIVGVRVRDELDGTEYAIPTGHVISATGVWTEEIQRLAGVAPGHGVQVLASKGIHLVFDRERIKGDAGLFLRTEKSVLFVIPWQRYWLVGTTDTPWDENLRDPVATSTDVEYVLRHANAVLRSDLTRADVIGVFAGLRPLVQPVETTSTAKISREHVVASIAPGLSAIAGGKLTTYRQMAEDAVDVVLGPAAEQTPSTTAELPLIGAAPWAVIEHRSRRLGKQYGWPTELAEHLGRRYGTETRRIAELIEADPALGQPLSAAPHYLRAEVVYAVRAEGALRLADVLRHRIRLAIESPDRGVAAADEIATLMAAELGWDAERVSSELAAWRGWAEAEEQAVRHSLDADAAAMHPPAG